MTAREPLRFFFELRDALLYPLHFHACIFIVIGSFLLWLLSSSLFGIVIVVALTTAFMHFLLCSLRESALGSTLPPMLTSDDMARPGSTPLKLLIAVIVWISVAKQMSLLSAFGGLLLTVVGYLLLPAFATLLVLEDSLRYALSPARLLRFVIRGGLPYLLLTATLAASLDFAIDGISADISAEGFTQGLVLRVPQPAALAWLMGGLYIATSFAHLLGRLSIRAHDFEPPPEHATRTATPFDANSPTAVAAALGELLRHNEREEVLAAWQSHADRDVDFHSDLLAALMRERAWGLVPLQAERTISMELLANRRLSALRHAMHVLNDFESFSTSTAMEWLALCEVASDTGNGEWLKLLARKATEKFSDHGELLDIALLHARYLSASENQIEAALTALRPFLEQNNHPRHAELIRLNSALQALQLH